MTEAIEHLSSGFISRTGYPSSISEATEFFSKDLGRINSIGLAAKVRVYIKFSSYINASDLIKDIEE